ncbi:Glycosyltransferase involved in cell wall bisynthesis [Flexibacter flexilis DSM 6793]|uniref:Glycosyltransferase involved in cell wall bisynthesis n=1 Tax=Flexibacter flexilis DSM 6793 TaxID=927664 RepID=A0A1I1FJI3_9BACT|nr:glycosyltransferase family 4 protein [Flexibacter flexilis]SFB99464.1 Glycosyltransferase involved in cell wall bisynthesis [Flexibacter flexilis DSM 6793]
MKVLHVLNAVSGGSAYSTFELIEQLKKQGIDSYLVCEKNGTQARRDEIKKMLGGKVIFLPLYRANDKIRTVLWKRPLLEMKLSLGTLRGHKFQAQLAQIVRDEKIDIVHTSTAVNTEGAILAQKMGLPHIWHIRELVGDDKHYQFGNHQKWVQTIEKQSAMIVANSNVTYDCIAPFMADTNKICTIPNAIDVQKFKPKTHTNSIDKKIVVGMVASLDARWKNHTLFVKIAGKLKTLSNVEFRIYGKIPPTTDAYWLELNALKKSLGLSDEQFKFMGHGTKPEVFWAEIDIMVHPNRFESFGRVFVEAMAAAIPVIGLNEGGALQMVRDGYNGFLVPENDIAYICDKIKLLTEDSALRQQLGNAGRVTVEQDFDMPILGKRIKALYEQILHSHSHK